MNTVTSYAASDEIVTAEYVSPNSPGKRNSMSGAFSGVMQYASLLARFGELEWVEIMTKADTRPHLIRKTALQLTGE